MSVPETVAKIAVDNAAFYFDKPFSYKIPPALREEVASGARVTVPFGRGNKRRSGLVLELCQEEDTSRCKEIASVYDRELCENEELFKLVFYLRETTFCTYYDAAKAILPAGVGITIKEYFLLREELLPPALTPRQQSAVEALRARRGRLLCADLLAATGWKPDARELRELLECGALERDYQNRRRYGGDQITWAKAIPFTGKLTPKQKAVYDWLCTREEGATLKELLYQTGVGRTVVDNLKKKGALALFERESYREVFDVAGREDPGGVVLTPAQAAVYDALSAAMAKRAYGCSLLYGVTGSGKTLVFIKLIENALRLGKQAILLVPEIALTPQVITRFKTLFGERVAVLHSGLSVGARAREYRRIKEGKADIVIGTRSAVFAPLRNIGIIILDEEQEGSYHSDSSPKYHARDVARFRAKYHAAQLVLASATPSVLTFSAAKRGEIALYQLPERYSGNALPQVELVDMKAELASGNTFEISRPLARQIQLAVGAGHQVILLINRRGYNTTAVCSSCGAVARCKHCDIPLTYHRQNGRLVCHYCGYSVELTGRCDNCGDSHLRLLGAGTQKVEDQLELLFPEARILRMDTDTTVSKDSHRAFLQAFAGGEYDILVGTQMVAKGLDFPNVTLVGVLGIDHVLGGQSYRSFERCFSLVTQVVGRGGRGAQSGRAVIQTFDPQNRVLGLASRQDYDAFFAEEMQARKYLLYPPFCDLCLIGLTGAKRERCIEAGRALMEILQRLAQGSYRGVPLRLMGPTPFLVERVSDKYRYKIIVKCKNNRTFRALLREAIAALAQQVSLRDVAVGVDFHPDNEI